MLGDAKLASQMADDMLQRGIYVIGFSYPVVPKGEARIRVQLSGTLISINLKKFLITSTAAHTLDQVDRCVDAFIEVGRTRGVIA